MKSKPNIFILSLAFSVFLFTACDKTDETPDDTNNTNTSSFNYPDAFGVLVAVKSISYTSVAGYEVPVEVNSASAFFPTDAGATSFADAGTVSIEGKNLSKVQNNVYVYNDYIDPLTLSNLQWSVTGNGSVPSFNKTVSRPIPTFSGFSSLPASVSKAAGLSIPMGSALYAADSVIVLITSSNNQVAIKSFAGNAGSATFSAADLSALSTSNVGSISISPYNISTETISGKKYYFVNESSYLKMAVSITQ
ncbi:MAG: hypothetical protein HGA37_02010 [Lentimicrobium sp.]|nr:hypothetical protein [Lentimicrobium sp.]